MGKANKKYELIRMGKMKWRHNSFDDKRFYQLVALRDIPLHGVKAGDLGGFVCNDKVLSHDGSCWIGEEAMVGPHVRVIDDAYVGGTASILNNFHVTPLTIADEAEIIGNPAIYLGREENSSSPEHGMFIGDQVKISGSPQICNVKEILSRVQISGEANLNGCEIIAGQTQISGKAKVGAKVSLMGKTVVAGSAVISRRVSLTDCIVEDGAFVEAIESGVNKIYTKDGTKPMNSSSGATAPEEKVAIEASVPETPEKPVLSTAQVSFHEIKESISAYETDIVKIIKYPVMTDRTDPYTRAMVKAVNIANRLAGEPESVEFINAVSELEDAFLAAESNALKIAATEIPEQGMKKLQKAKDMLRIASNEASSEQEKKVAFVQGFKQLEGVIAVPEVAVDTFRVKIGLKEIEAF